MKNLDEMTKQKEVNIDTASIDQLKVAAFDINEAIKKNQHDYNVVYNKIIEKQKELNSIPLTPTEELK